jgi:hypothetical protein
VTQEDADVGPSDSRRRRNGARPSTPQRIEGLTVEWAVPLDVLGRVIVAELLGAIDVTTAT